MQNYRDFDAVIDPLFSPVLGFAIESPEVGIVPESDDLEVLLRGRQGLKNRITTGFFGSRGPGNGLAVVPEVASVRHPSEPLHSKSRCGSIRRF